MGPVLLYAGRAGLLIPEELGNPILHVLSILLHTMVI